MIEVEAPTRGYMPTKDQLLKRLRRIEGRVRGVQKVVEDDRWTMGAVGWLAR